MKVVFWQNIISPHQFDFINEVSKQLEVVLVVDKEIDNYRKMDGWSIPQYTNLDIYVNPSNETIYELFQDQESVHIFSGIGSYKVVNKGFKIAIKKNCKIGIFSEPIKMKGVKGFVKYLRGNIQRIKYGPKINFIAATGDLGVETYIKFGYKSDIIFQWGYFVDPINLTYSEKEKSLIYVGQLTERKNILRLASLFVNNDGLGYTSLNIIGKGPLLNDLRAIKKESNKCEINLLGRLSPQETMEAISKSSLLIIPSKFDGWAVVVNEALLQGTPVIASSNVGASVLLDGERRGEMFKYNDFEQLKFIIKKWSKKSLTAEDSSEIKNWAEKTISPVVAASYFYKILNFTFSDLSKKPKAPWTAED